MSQTQQPNNAFLPSDYETPQSESDFFKLKEPGSHKIRILSSPITGWLEWETKDGKQHPVRYRQNAKPTTFINATKPPEFFWILVIWSYTHNRIMVWETRSKVLIAAMESHAKNPDWGNPIGYNATVTRKGTTKENTEYSFIASPPTPLPIEAFNGFNAKPICLNLLYTGGDCFKPEGNPITPMLPGAQVAAQQATQAAPAQNTTQTVATQPQAQTHVVAQPPQPQDTNEAWDAIGAPTQQEMEDHDPNPLPF